MEELVTKHAAADRELKEEVKIPHPTPEETARWATSVLGKRKAVREADKKTKRKRLLLQLLTI